MVAAEFEVVADCIAEVAACAPSAVVAVFRKSAVVVVAVFPIIVVVVGTGLRAAEVESRDIVIAEGIVERADGGEGAP